MEFILSEVAAAISMLKPQGTLDGGAELLSSVELVLVTLRVACFGDGEDVDREYMWRLCPCCSCCGGTKGTRCVCAPVG